MNATAMIGFLGRGNAREETCKKVMKNTDDFTRKNIVYSITDLAQKIGERKVLEELEALCEKHNI